MGRPASQARLTRSSRSAAPTRVNTHQAVTGLDTCRLQALGTPLVTLWGPGIFEQTAPISPGNPPRILYHRVQCSPCYGTPALKTCKNNICMKEIQVEEVKRTLEEILALEPAR